MAAAGRPDADVFRQPPGLRRVRQGARVARVRTSTSPTRTASRRSSSRIINGHFDAAGALLDTGANPNIADAIGRTPLFAAVDMNTVPSSNRPGAEDRRERDDRARAHHEAPRPRRQPQRAAEEADAVPDEGRSRQRLDARRRHDAVSARGARRRRAGDAPAAQARRRSEDRDRQRHPRRTSASRCAATRAASTR